MYVCLPGGTASGFYTVDDDVSNLVYTYWIVCVILCVCFFVGCSYTSLSDLWKQEAIPRASKYLHTA